MLILCNNEVEWFQTWKFSRPSKNKQIKNSDFANDLFKIITFSQPSDAFKAGSGAMNATKQYEMANQKFSQGNITAAYKDYKSVLNTNRSDDFVYLGFAYKLSNLGLFSLAQEAINNIGNVELYKTQIEMIKKVFVFVWTTGFN